MGNGDKGGSGGLGSLGAPGYRESKQVSGKTEIMIPLYQSGAIFLSVIALSFGTYLALKLVIVDRADWSLLIGIATIVALIPLGIILDRSMRWYAPHFYRNLILFSNRIVAGDNLMHFILWAIVVGGTLFSIFYFYVDVIVPQMVIIANEQAHYVFLLCSLLGGFVAFRYYFAFNKRQLTDTLRDSDKSYAIRALEIESEEKTRKAEAIDALFTVIEEPEPPEQELPHAVLIKAPEKSIPAQNENDILYKTAIVEFLEGIEKGKWDTTEASWRGDKRLEKSGFTARAVGNRIRDDLIKGGWARWQNPSDHTVGWALNFSSEEVGRMAFNDSKDNKINQAPPKDV